MNPQDPQSNPVQNPLAAMRENERIIFEAKRHPIGIIGIYIVSGLLLVGLATIAFVVVPSATTNTGNSQLNTYAGLAFGLLAILIVAFMLISNYVYWRNRWILTDDSLTQVIQRSLFDKQSSQLSLANLEDVTVQQNGILSHIFNFGTIKAETAGERSKFVLNFCPNPNDYARQILEARENFEQGKPEQTENQSNPAAPAPGQQPAGPPPYS